MPAQADPRPEVRRSLVARSLRPLHGVMRVTAVPRPLLCAVAAQVEYRLMERRPGDSVAVWAATETAENELSWKSK
jgi:hypothetical protein